MHDYLNIGPLFNPWKTGMGKFIAIFWTINDPPGGGEVLVVVVMIFLVLLVVVEEIAIVSARISASLSVYCCNVFKFINLFIYS